MCESSFIQTSISPYTRQSSPPATATHASHPIPVLAPVPEHPPDAVLRVAPLTPSPSPAFLSQMTFRHAAAALASTIDYRKPADIAVAADFFHAYPRLSSIPKTFATDVAYRASIYKLAIPYAATGLVLFLAALIANFYFFFKRGVVPGADDTHESDPNSRDCTARAFLLFSWFLNLAIFICIGIAFGNAFSMRQAANNAHVALDAAKNRIIEQLQAPAVFLEDLAEKAEKGSAALEGTESNVLFFIRNHASSFQRVVNATEGILDSATLIDDQFKHLSLRYFLLTMSVLVASIIGLLCSFILDASIPTSKSVRIVTFALLLLPMIATWTHTAFSTSIAAASGKFGIRPCVLRVFQLSY